MIHLSRTVPAGEAASAGIAVIEPVPFLLGRRDVLRLLGYDPRGRPPSPPIERLLDECVREAEGLVRARGCYALKTPVMIPPSGPFRGAERIAFGVCTIGPHLPRRVSELSAEGETLRALILDAIGSSAVESATGVVHAMVCEEARRGGMFARRRISPGYPSWPIDGQREIFALLPSRITGVALTPGCFMDPRKSVSFAVGAGRNFRRSHVASPCARCSLLRCRYRREAESRLPATPSGAGAEEP